MTPHEWQGQWKRLDQFRVSGDAKRTDVSAEWFAQLKHYHVDAVEHGITQLIGTAQDTFLPGLGLLRDLIKARIDRYERVHHGCPTCHGSTWIEAWPMVWDGRVYEMLARCPDCGVPAPEMKKPHPGARPATKLEYEEWKAGEAMRDTMPEGLKAKPWKPGAREAHKAEMRAMFDRLRIKLFGHQDDAA